MSEQRRHPSVSKTDQEIADKINESLPVKLTASDVEHNPEFVKLMTAVSQHLTEEGGSVAVHRDLTQAQESLKHDKNSWLQHHILYTELQELLLDHQLQVAQGTPSSHSQFYKAVKECVTLAEIGDYLDCNPDPTSETTLLGIKKEDVQRINPHRKHLQSIQQKLIPEVEARLRKKCETLFDFYQCASPAAVTGEADSSKFNFAKASQLPALLEADKHTLQDEQRQLKRDRNAREKHFWQCYQALLESLHILEELITKHRLHSQSESDTITSEWLTARCDAICLKIKMQEYELLCDTYYEETVQALTKIRKSLDSTVRETQDEILQASQALKAYESVGMGFDSLVQEYTYLRDEIDNKKWGFRELKQSLNGV